MPRSPESIRAAAAKNRQSIDGQIERAQPQKLRSYEARRILLSAQEDNDAGREALKKMQTLKTIPGFFPTPDSLVSKMLWRALDSRHHPTPNGNAYEGMRVLEPSAGKGNIAIVASNLGATVDCYEVNYQLREELLRFKDKYNLVGDDFLAAVPDPKYDVVLMNPPFEKHVDRVHICHAFDFLKPGGVLVSIASGGALNESSAGGRNFREWLGLDDANADDKEVFVWNIEDGAFAGPDSERFTNVRTLMLRIIKCPKKKGFPYGQVG